MAATANWRHCAPPIVQPALFVRINPALPQTSRSQNGERGQDEDYIANINRKRRPLHFEPEKGLHRVGQDGDSEEENKIDHHIQGSDDELVPENAVMLQPEPANQREGDYNCQPTRRLEDFLDAGGDIQPQGDKRQAETEDQIAKGLQP